MRVLNGDFFLPDVKDAAEAATAKGGAKGGLTKFTIFRFEIFEHNLIQFHFNNI